jgi:Ca2+-transporting ATPase
VRPGTGTGAAPGAPAATFDGERWSGIRRYTGRRRSPAGDDPTSCAPSRIAEIPFDSARKLMATFHDEDSHVLLCVKGGPDVLLEHCTLDRESRARVDAAQAALAADGHRVLAVATRRLARDALPTDALEPFLVDLEFAGLIALQDPPRPEARAAVAACHRAGVRVLMITGDHESTATAIARQLGLGTRVMSGADLEASTTAS